ncbi:hypothetical protein QFC22_001422 [Naganishia vaughanmartiniae]|uniref:Uncharacterized protein n=1 Tax=Naganishia vaughanmartiniae TaxID=1424756 RepID=A0ACC2XKI4_9TREE|nr:hypothetical protein QFC22_001422 [Naganishia vaughanmartiniae]
MVQSPYSGAVPQASTSTGSLFRLQSEINSRARSKSNAAEGSGLNPRHDQPYGYRLGGIRPGWSTGPAAMVPLADSSRGIKDAFDDSSEHSRHLHGFVQGGSFPLYSRPYANPPDANNDIPYASRDSTARPIHSSFGSLNEELSVSVPATAEMSPSYNATGGKQHPLSNTHSIHQELRNSKDEGDTLDLSRKQIQRIEEGDVQMLRTKVGRRERGVLRLALSHNRLTESSLDPSFSMLNRLRYLNLKGNKLKSLPQCVLSISQNRLTRLPGYFVHFAALQVLKVDNNPIEWPVSTGTAPPPILDSTAIVQDSSRSVEEQMRIWIASLKAWMKEADEQEQIKKAAEITQESSPNPDQDRPHPHLALPHTPVTDTGTPILESTLLAESEEDSMATPTASKHDIQLGSTKRRRANGSTGTLQVTGSPSSSLSTHSSESSIKALAASSQSSIRRLKADDSGVSLVRETSSSSTIKHGRPGSNHARGSSFTDNHRSSLGLSTKKSLPDLREGLTTASGDGATQFNNLAPRDSIRSSANFHVNSLPTSRQGSIDDGTSESKSERTKGIDEVVKRMSKSLEKRESRSIGNKLDFISAIRTPSTVDEARDAYFKRLWTLPAGSLPDAIPEPLLRAMDAVRGVMYSMTQLHFGLKQFLVFSNNKSVLEVFARVLDPATDFLHALVNALDRFDSMSRRRLPTVAVIKQVFECCRDAITVFIKVSGVLTLQIQALRQTANQRYARTLLMLVTGCVSEVVGSWRIIAAVASDIRSLFQVDPPLRSAAHRSKPSMSSSLRTPISPIPEKAEIQSPQAVPTATTSTVEQETPSKSSGGANRGSPLRTNHVPREKSRRNAGSFSAEDLQAGMMLGPSSLTSPATSETGTPLSNRAVLYDHSRSTSVVSQTVIPEVDNEDGDIVESDQRPPSLSTTGNILVAASSKGATYAQGNRDKLMRRNRAHMQKSSTGSEDISVRLPSLNTDVSPVTPHSPAHVVDDGVLDTLEQAAAIADTVWLRLSEELTGSPTAISPAILVKKFGQPVIPDLPPRSPVPPVAQRSRRVQDALVWIARAEAYTRKLHESLMQARANPSLLILDQNTSSRLPFDAQNFIKAVVVVSKLLKAVSAERPIPASVKNLLQRLTGKTSECAILLEVSSLKPVKTPLASSTIVSIRPSSPAFTMV